MLSVLGAIYGKVIDVRNRLYDRGVFRVHGLGARTVSVGNLTTGGTGKTPLVAYVASILANRGEKVCVLTRGYGRSDPGRRVVVSNGENILTDARTAGDEPYELAQKLIGKAIVIADADRVAAAKWAIDEFGISVFVLDDGFQHRRAKRDVDIVCIDATDPAGDGRAAGLSNGKMLPAGRLREPVHNLVRADIIVITRSALVEDISDLRSEISNLCPNSNVFLANNRISQSQDEIDGLSVAAFCGLGNPDAFFDQMRNAGVNLVAAKAYPDHHRYSQNDVYELEQIAVEAGGEYLMTTAKDAVKLSELKFEMPLLVIEIEVELDDPKRFAELI
ncbi:MAG: tetraacyldisaccharide 4'-kinase [Pyrinomonadaceae bacterium]